jgi:hypothetical protein
MPALLLRLTTRQRVPGSADWSVGCCAHPSIEDLGAAIAALKAEARRRGLTDEIVDEELAAYNAERRDAPSAR